MCVYAAAAGCRVPGAALGDREQFLYQSPRTHNISHNVYYLMIHWRWMHVTLFLIFGGFAHPYILLLHTMVCYLNIGLHWWIC